MVLRHLQAGAAVTVSASPSEILVNNAKQWNVTILQPDCKCMTAATDR